MGFAGKKKENEAKVLKEIISHSREHKPSSSYNDRKPKNEIQNQKSVTNQSQNSNFETPIKVPKITQQLSC